MAKPKLYSSFVCVWVLRQFEYLDWIATQVGLAGVDERLLSIYKNYYKFVAAKGEWVNRRQWEPGNEFQEHDLEAKNDQCDSEDLPIINP